MQLTALFSKGRCGVVVERCYNARGAVMYSKSCNIILKIFSLVLHFTLQL